MKVERVFLIVLDGVGVGELPDAWKYGDQGSNTLGNMSRIIGGLNLPHLEQAGLGKLTSIEGVSNQLNSGIYGKMAERSAGKDTTTGHWEMAGLILERPFPLYPQGFPGEIITEFELRTKQTTLGNKAASGTEIIAELGEKHLNRGGLIVYTSADSVFQIAAHEERIPRAKLYEYCEIAREILQGEHSVARVIARPFLGRPGAFYRTEGRKDFSLKPFAPTVLDRLKDNGLGVYGVGKIEDIFCMQGLTDTNHTHNNQETLNFLGEMLEKPYRGLIFANCIDFDMVYGHRNDPVGFGRALTIVDTWLSQNLCKLREGDILMMTGDHGGDPTTLSTDHSREYTPLLIWGPGLTREINLGIRDTFADIAATLCQWFNLPPWPVGKEFASEIHPQF